MTAKGSKRANPAEGSPFFERSEAKRNKTKGGSNSSLEVQPPTPQPKRKSKARRDTLRKDLSEAFDAACDDGEGDIPKNKVDSRLIWFFKVIKDA